MNETTSTTHTSYSIPVYPVILAVVLGVIVGHFTPGAAVKMKIIGTIFLNLLFVLVIPLIISSMITGISGLGDIRHVGTIGFRTCVFYLSTTLLSVLTGLILVTLIVPGKGVARTSMEFPDSHYTIVCTPISVGSILQLSDST